MATMIIESYLEPESVIAQHTAASAKAVLSALAHLLSENCPVVSEDQAFTGLLQRERLGSTALGYGVALPHAKVAGITQPIAAVITTQMPVDFRAQDNAKVDVIFGLLMPLDPQLHLEVLRIFAGKLSQSDYRAALRAATTVQDLYCAAVQ